MIIVSEFWYVINYSPEEFKENLAFHIQEGSEYYYICNLSSLVEHYNVGKFNDNTLHGSPKNSNLKLLHESRDLGELIKELNILYPEYFL